MANVNSPFGMKPVMNRDGSPWNGKGTLYYIRAAYATRLGLWDPVVAEGTYADTLGIPTVARAAASGYILGSIIGFVPLPDSLALPSQYSKASTEGYCYVCDDPGVIYEMQEDSVGGAMAATEAMGNADLVISNCSTATGVSAAMIDSSTAGTTSTYNLRLLRLVQRPDNAQGNYAKWLVQINLHSLLYATGV